MEYDNEKKFKLPTVTEHLKPFIDIPKLNQREIII